MTIAAIRTDKGTFRGVTDDGRISAAEREISWTACFELVELPDDRIALKAIATQTFVHTQPDRSLPLRADSTEVGPSESFALHQAGDLYCLEAESGACVSAAGGGQDVFAMRTDVGVWELFHLERQAEIAEALGGMCSCCGHAHARHEAGQTSEPDSRRVKWNDDTHALVVDTAARIVGALQFTAPGADEFSQHFWGNRTFRGERESIAKRLTQGGTVRDWEWRDCGQHLGFALHNFSDLTQPMHAANFIQFWGDRPFPYSHPGDQRHSAFEAHVDAHRREFLVDPTNVPLAEVQPTNWQNPAFLVQALASHSLQIYNDHLRLVLKQKESWMGKAWAAYRFTNHFTLDETRTTLEKALPFGQKVTAGGGKRQGGGDLDL